MRMHFSVKRTMYYKWEVFELQRAWGSHLLFLKWKRSRDTDRSSGVRWAVCITLCSAGFHLMDLTWGKRDKKKENDAHLWYSQSGVLIYKRAQKKTCWFVIFRNIRKLGNAQYIYWYHIDYYTFFLNILADIVFTTIFTFRLTMLSPNAQLIFKNTH